MNEALAALVALNDLEMLDDNLFRGNSPEGNRIYGGLVLSQSLSAAQRTVAEPMTLHSMHAYFMRPGDTRRPVIYDVESIRDGRSFVTRRVVARQHGEAIFSCQLSYQKPESGFEHQAPMPGVPAPEQLITDEERWQHLPPGMAHERRWPIEYRQVDPQDWANPVIMAPNAAVWLRAADRLPDPLALHQTLFAYASDMHILGTALRPHGVGPLATEGLQVATIDHSIWYHRPFRVDEWLLYALYTPSGSNGRGYSQGRVYKRDGTLVASVSQEGLIRLWKA